MKKALLGLALLCLACNEKPLGEEALDVRGDFRAQTIDLQLFSSFTEVRNIPVGSSTSLILGENGRYRSRVLLDFAFADTTYQGADEIKLILFRDDDFENDTVGFTLHLLENEFAESEATWDSRNDNDAWDVPGGDYHASALRTGQFTGDSVVLTFNYVELAQIVAADGLILLPSDSGFVALEARESGRGASFTIRKNETTETPSLTGDCHIIKDLAPPNYWDNWLGSGVSYRNYVRFQGDPAIAGMKAVFGELVLRRTGDWFGLQDSFEIAVKELEEPFTGFQTELGSIIELARFAFSDTIYTLDIVRHIQRIIDHPDSNFGFVLYVSPENYGLCHVQLATGMHELTVGFVPPPAER